MEKQEILTSTWKCSYSSSPCTKSVSKSYSGFLGLSQLCPSLSLTWTTGRASYLMAASASNSWPLPTYPVNPWETKLGTLWKQSVLLLNKLHQYLIPWAHKQATTWAATTCRPPARYNSHKPPARLPLSLSPFYRWGRYGWILGWLMPLPRHQAWLAGSLSVLLSFNPGDNCLLQLQGSLLAMLLPFQRLSAGCTPPWNCLSPCPHNWYHPSRLSFLVNAAAVTLPWPSSRLLPVRPV